ncbi:LamG domain-containing protein [Spirillospora sp. NPDC000708]
MSSNLVLHWHLDALSPDSRALDSSDNHLQGTVVGDPKNQPDERFGSVLAFNGTADALTLADTPLIRLSAYTVEVWVKPKAPLGGLVGKPPGDLRLVLNADGSVAHHFSTAANADETHATGPGAVTAGTWQHLAIVNDGRTASIYVNGKQVSTDAYTGARTVQNLALQVGQGYGGSLAHLRVYDGALADLEIQRDMADDEAALAAFVRSHPLDFALLDVDQQPVLFIDDAPGGQPMTLRLTNTSRQDIEFVPGTAPLLALHLRTGVLAVPPQPAVLTPGWTLQTTTDQATGDTVLGLTSTAPPTIPRGGTYDLRLQGLSADGTGGTRGTRVEMVYQNMRYAGEQDQLTGNRIAFLDVVNRRGRKTIPLAASFVGGNRVLCDGTTANTLRIRIANLSRDASLSLAGASFTLSYPAQAAGETREWALSDVGQAGNAVLGGLVADKVAADWTITPQNLGQRMQWKLTPPAAAAFDADGSIVVTLSQVFALSSLGQVQFVLGYQNVPGYQDGAITLTAEKSPLMFAGQNTGIGTTAPAGKLQIVNTDQDPNGDTLVLGPTDQSHLRLGYNKDYSWVQSQGGRPLVLNGTANNVTIGTTAAQAARLSVSADNSHLQLRREKNAGGGSQIFLELFQDSTGNGVYPAIRFHHTGVFWHRIEGRYEGLMFKNGDPTSDGLSDIYASNAKVNGLSIGGVTIGASELQILKNLAAGSLSLGGTTVGGYELSILQKLASGSLQFDLLNTYQNEYAYAADYNPYDGSRRYVFTWRTKGERVNQGSWQIAYPR